MASAVAADGESWMVERAKEELQMLEAMHPNRFDYLKLELKSFIFEVDANTYDSYASAAAVAAATQASSNNRHKRKKSDEEIIIIHDHEQNMRDYSNSPLSSSEKKKKKKKTMMKKGKDRVDMVIERAEACLKRIQLVKQTFFQ